METCILQNLAKFGGQHNEGLDKRQLDLFLQGMPNVITLPTPERKRPPASRSGTPHTARPMPGAVIYTLLGSSGRHGINPFDYMKDLFTRLPSAKMTQIKEFTPAAWAKAKAKENAVAEAA